MTPKVSILVPVYNVSNYIERCAHSLFRQTFEDIEYIFVNDCTPDDSIEKLQKVIEQYPNRKPHIKIIHHKKNRGLSVTRNTALEHSTGKYIQHIDSDDWVEPEMIETLYEKAEMSEADIIVSDVIIEYHNRHIVQLDTVAENKEDNFHNMLENKNACGYLWNKLVNKKLYNLSDCRPVEGLNYWEDLHVSIRLYYHAVKIVKVNQIFYHYNKTNQNAITYNKVQFHFKNVILFWKLLDDFIKENGICEKYADTIEFSKVKSKVALITQTHSYKLRKEYAWLFRDVEMKYFNKFRLGEKIILFCTHYRFYRLAHVTHLLLVWKNRQ